MLDLEKNNTVGCHIQIVRHLFENCSESRHHFAHVWY